MTTLRTWLIENNAFSWSMRAVGAASVLFGLLALYSGLFIGLGSVSVGVSILFIDSGIRKMRAILVQIRNERKKLEFFSGEISRNQQVIAQHLAAIIEAKKTAPPQ